MSEAYMTGVNGFLDDLASGSPAPGGGAAAAVVGAIGVSLTSMVCNLTIGKKKYAEVSDEAAGILEKANGVRAKLIASYSEDVEAFENVMAAYELPKSNDEEKAARRTAIQDSMKAATITPMECAQAGIAGLELALAVAKIGNTNAISDAGAGSLSLVASVYAATLNMRINIASIKDQDFATKHAAIVDELEAKATQLGQEIREIVLAKI